MGSFIKYIIDYTEGNLSESERKVFEDELLHNSELKQEYDTFIYVNKTMQGNADINSIEPELENIKIDEESKKLIEEYQKNPLKYDSIRDFVKSATLNSNEERINIEVNQINEEIREKNIDTITKKWVDEWNSDHPSIEINEKNKIRNFVTSSLEGDQNSNISKHNTPAITWYKSTVFKIVGFSVAASIVILFVLQTLILPTDPNELFETNYKPYQAITTITRGSETEMMNNQALMNYRQGNYEIAALEFDLLVSKDPQDIAALFFGGLSNIELGNYTKAIDLLSKVKAKNLDYTIEARWYIGLISLKTGDVEGAYQEFEALSKNPGFYQKTSKNILRKLKR